MTACTDCESGKVSFNANLNGIGTGMTSCSLCPGGTFFSNAACENCPTGFFCTQGVKKSCSEAVPEKFYINPQHTCAGTKDAMLIPCTNCSAVPGQYTKVRCTQTSDSVCAACSKCNTDDFEKYTLSECGAYSDTECFACNSSAGDMTLGSGRCNLCPPGSYFVAEDGSCSLCPPGAYAPRPNATACLQCPTGMISTVGASRCVPDCKSQGHAYSPSGIASACVSSSQAEGFKTLVSAWDTSFMPLLSAAAPVVSYSNDQTMSDSYFLGATRKANSQVFLLTLQHSWSVAGNGYAAAEIVDGKGALAAFSLITSMAMDTLFARRVEGTSSIACTSRYLLTEYNAGKKRGHLRMFTLRTSWTDDSVHSFEGETKTLGYHAQVSNPHAWLWPVQIVFDDSSQEFFVLDMQINGLLKIKVDYDTELITACKRVLPASSNFNPLSVTFLRHPVDDLKHGRGLIVLLDNSRIVGVNQDSTMQWSILCGGGAKTLPWSKGSALPCNEVNFAQSGATQVLATATNDPPGEVSSMVTYSSSSFVIYVLLLSQDYSSSAVAQIRIAPDLTDVLNSGFVSIFSISSSSDNPAGVLSFPLHFMPIFSSASSVMKSLHLVESRGGIKRLGGGTHLNPPGCLCDAGLYCDWSGSKQCLDAPPGTYTDGFWATETIPCPMGMVARKGRSSACDICPAGYTPSASSAYCEPSCPGGQIFDEETKECITGCSVSRGLYDDPLTGRCLPCWWGSQATGGKGVESCVPCSLGEYGKLPGVCAHCPAGKTTWREGCTVCMPNHAELSLTSSEKMCLDGAWSQECPPPDTPTALLLLHLNSTDSAWSIAGSIDGVLFLSLLSKDKSFALVMYDTSRGLITETLAAGSLEIYYHMQLCEQCLLPNPARFVFHARNLGTCIYRTIMSAENSTVEVFSGDCRQPGPLEQNMLPPIHSIALMESDQLSPILYISVLSANCAEVYSLSLYDKTLMHFVSQDALRYAPVFINECILVPLILASSKGSSGFLFAARGNKLYATQVAGAGARPETFLENPVLQLAQDEAIISAITVSSINRHIVVSTQAGRIYSIPPSANSAYSEMSSIIIPDLPAAEGVASAITSMTLIGRRLWYTDRRNQKIYQVLLSKLRGCVGGFVVPDEDASSPEGICMQAGRGLYTAFDGSLQSCPPGTYGLQAGGAIQAAQCRACPDGRIASKAGSAYCKECPPGSYANPFGTECVATCPPGTLKTSRSCVPCQPGYSSSAVSSAVCMPCPEGTYSNQETSWQCRSCASGYASPKGAHHCVRICQKEDTCALDGQNCVSLTKEYKVLSQISMATFGQQIIGLAVDRRGGVFYTNGHNIMYYLDDCTSFSSTCDKKGIDLLQAQAYTGYSFFSLSICNQVQPASPASICPRSQFFRNLYVTSLAYNSVYVLRICQNSQGTVDPEGTLESGGLIRLAGFNGNGFADGPFSTALFNQPADMDINSDCTLLYLSDFFNHRIRVLNLTSNRVSTIAGTGRSCWKMGNATCSDPGQGCNPLADDCASTSFPVGIGLSKSEDTLFIAANSINSLVRLLHLKGLAARRRLSNDCRFSRSNMVTGTEEQCSLSPPKSKGCMLFKPFDVVSVTDVEMYVGVSQGITKIYSEDEGRTFKCEQIAGKYFDLHTTGFKDGIRPLASPESVGGDTPTSMVNMPFKISFAEDRGVLYFADLMNGAVRRILVKTACTCPVGTTLLPSIAACYNPSPTWSKKTLPPCPRGLYALEGDATCFRNCTEAVQQGLSFAPCLASSGNAQFRTFTYRQLLGDLATSTRADWYGFSSRAIAHSWRSIFDSMGTPSPIYYRQGRVPGRAPFGRDFVSLTYSTTRRCWYEETQYLLRPVLLLPGLWYPCQEPVAQDKPCSCPVNVNIFESLPVSQAEKDASATAPKRWQALRNAAATSRAAFLDSQCNDLRAAVGASSSAPCTLRSRSVFMILGSPNEPSPTACSASASEGGPCFPIVKHVPRTDSDTLREITYESLQASSSDWGTSKHTLSCFLGWPAHSYCPNGYVWIAPSSPAPSSLCNPVASQATCLSCLPGTFSFADLASRQSTGGPYKCRLCDKGTFSSSVGSSVCRACPVGRYASIMGSSQCETCSVGQYTQMPMAYSASQCVDCLPGTGNCTDCTVGTYQNNAGQIRCLLTPPGFYTNTSNASFPIPCSPGFFQPHAGRSSCERCPFQTFTHGQGAMECIPCTQTNCTMALHNECGRGCGLNRFWDLAAEKCTTCRQGTLNANDECAKSGEACWQAPRRDYYISESGELQLCPLGTEAEIVNFKACIPCKEGTFSDSGTKGCQPCPAGKFAETTSATTCSLCSPGHVSTAPGQAECSPCRSGTFAAGSGTSVCVDCPAGQYSANFKAATCNLCSYGVFNNASGMTTCDGYCDDSTGHFSLPGDTACRFCEGTINVTLQCQGCGLGSYFHDDDSLQARGECRPCPIGLVNPNDTAATSLAACRPCPSKIEYASSTTVCTEASLGFVPNASLNGQRPCPPGSVRNATMLECTPCPPGKFGAEEASVTCSECRRGLFADAPGLSVCRLCSIGKVSEEDGSVACQHCNAGTHSERGIRCQPCARNTFSEVNGSAECSICPANKFSLMGATACSYCPAGTALVQNRSTRACGLCPPGQRMIQSPFSSFYTCQHCLMGKYISFPSGGLAPPDCSNCPPGLVALRSGLSTCVPCAPGQYPTSTSTCDNCLRGNYSADGQRCIECPGGSFSGNQRASKCDPCPQGSYQDMAGMSACVHCAAGTFSNTSGNTGCTSCLSLPNTFTTRTGMKACTLKRQECKFGQYLNLTTDNPQVDNGCIDCVPCTREQLTLFLRDKEITNNVLSYTTEDTREYFEDICPGNTNAPLYQCIPSTLPPGLYISLNVRVGASGSAAETTERLLFQQCEDRHYNPQLVQWVSGSNNIKECFVGCMYGINRTAALTYMQRYGVNAEEEVRNNIFLKRMLQDVGDVCLPCPLISPCPVGRFRPRGEINPLCGPPCAIRQSPPLCSEAEMLTGCIRNCTNRPENAGYIGGSDILGSNECPWTCAEGFHLSDDRSQCIPCLLMGISLPEENATRLIVDLCNSSEYVVLSPEECLPWHTSTDLCKVCPRVPNSRSIGWDNRNGICKYQCYPGFFLSNISECSLCTVILEDICPIGMYLDRESCELRGERPVCKPCAARPMLNFTSNGGLNASKCRGVCPPGFHTVSLLNNEYFSPSKLNLLPYVLEAECRICTPNDGRTCHRPLGSACFGGFYKNLSVGEAQQGSCLPCRRSHQCQGKGFYAPQCSGNEVADAPCLPCSEDDLKDGGVTTKQYIAYDVIPSLSSISAQQVISARNCPRVCLNNFVRDAASPNKEHCISCRSSALQAQMQLDPSKIMAVTKECIEVGNQPSACSFVFAHWNATPAKPWWDLTATPWLPSLQGQRAGICWACPGGRITSEKDTDLCTLLPGFVSGTTDTLPSKTSIPAMPDDVSLAINAIPSAKSLLFSLSRKKQSTPRRLMTLNLSASAITEKNNNNNNMLITMNNNQQQQQQQQQQISTAVEGIACPHGYYKPNQGEGMCYACPLGSSTRSTGSITQASCMCFFGYYRTSNRQGAFFCQPCPEDTFKNISVSVMHKTTEAQAQCTPCPRDQTTYGTVGATRCVCRLGMILDPTTGLCSWCKAGYYCAPCDGNECPLEGIMQVQCFQGASSPEGSYDVENCTCADGMVRKARPKNPNQYYCLRIPMGGETDIISGKVVCKRGWTTVSQTEDGSATECALCPMGQYARILPFSQNRIVLSVAGKPICTPCPKGSYLPSVYGMGIESCVMCPSMQSTKDEGATSLQNCLCPATMAKDPVRGTCVGCSPMQYVDPKNTSLCLDCPSNAIAQSGAASVSQCLCLQGFYSLSVKADTLKCVPCPRGTYSSYASSNGFCAPCPVGSTTFRVGSTKLSACGEDATLCSSGYLWRAGVGCFKNEA